MTKKEQIEELLAAFSTIENTPRLFEKEEDAKKRAQLIQTVALSNLTDEDDDELE